MYAKIENNAVIKYPYVFNDLRKDNPLISFPDNALENESIRSEYGVEKVVHTDHANKSGFKYTETTPVLDGAVWKQSWAENSKDVSELRADEITPVPEPKVEGKRAENGAPELVGDEWRETWVLVDNSWRENRVDSYGAPVEQLEFITENGLEAWQAKVAEIKAKYPKS